MSLLKLVFGSETLMAAKRKSSRKSAPQPSLTSAMFNELLEGPGRKLVVFVTVMVAVAYIFGGLKPVIESGPLPLPSRQEVTTLRADTDKKFDATQHALDATAAAASAANVAAQNALSESNANRLDRLLQQRTNLQTLLRMTPNDPTLQQALTKTDIDIADVTTRIRSAAGIISTQPAPAVTAK